METLFNTEMNKNLNEAEFEALLQEFKTDYNQTHFVRNKEFKEAADKLQGPLRQIFVEFLERSCTAEFSGFLLYKELGRRLKGHLVITNWYQNSGLEAISKWRLVISYEGFIFNLLLKELVMFIFFNFAYESLGDDLRKTSAALVGNPLKTYQCGGGGAGLTLASAVCATPAATISPASAAMCVPRS